MQVHTEGMRARNRLILVHQPSGKWNRALVFHEGALKVTPIQYD
jgi:hypothetical protein